MLANGSRLGWDGWEAELALPPLALDPEELRLFARHVGQSHRDLASLVTQYASQRLPRLELHGYSTHLSTYCSMVDVAEVCALYARTMAPAMMLLLDRRSSPGLLVRPRARRFEVGGEYLPPDDRLVAAATFFVGSFLVAWEAVLQGEGAAGLPFELDPAAIEEPWQRPGHFVARDAFGDDLYTRGRRARLRLCDGSTLLAQEALEACWRRAREALAPLAQEQSVALTDELVGGRRRLPCELARGEPGFSLFASRDDEPGSPPAEPSTPGLWSLAAWSGAGAKGGGYRLTPESGSWAGIVFRVEPSAGDPFFANVPRRFLGAFHDRLDSRPLAEALRQFSQASAEDGPRPVLEPEKVEDLGLFSELAPELQAGRLGPPASKKKKKPELPLEGCEVTLLEEAGELSPPVVEICVPETRDGLVPIKPQEPPINGRIGGDGVMLHNGGFTHEQSHHAVAALGFAFDFHQYYRSFIDYDGIVGQRWDHGYNQRVVPTEPELARTTDFGWCELYTGPETSRSGDLWYYSGTGRRTFHEFASWHHRKVRYCGPQGGLENFRAVVTVYRQNPGERAQIQRYAVYDGRSPWEHPIFYVRRGHEGSEQIFNCWGYLIALRDPQRNLMRFYYGLPFNPATGYLVLRRIVDTSGRRYDLDYAVRAGQLRLVRLRDPWGREVSLGYSGRGELIEVETPGGRLPRNRRLYRYTATVGQLEEIVKPHEAATAPTAQPTAYLHNTYNADDQVSEQRVGTPAGASPATGGSHELEYQGDWVKKMTDRRGTTTDLVFEPRHDTYVQVKSSIRNQPLSLPGITISVPQPSEYATEIEYDSEFRITKIVRPGGSTEHFDFEQRNAPVTEGDERDWVERDWTHPNNLSAGNLLRHRIVSPRANDRERVTKWKYEPLFNRATEVKEPTGTTLYTFDNGWCATSYKNARPLEIERPKQLNPDGSTTPVKETYVYGPGGLATSFVDADGMETTYAWDGAGILTSSVRDPGGQSLELTCRNNDRGLTTFRREAGGLELTYEYDERDNLVAIRDQLGHETRYTHDANDRITSMEQDVVDDPAPFPYPQKPTRVRVTKYEYDILDQLRAETIDPAGLGLRTEIEYDGEENEILRRSPRATGPQPDEAAAIVKRRYDVRGLEVAVVIAPGHADESASHWLRSSEGFVTHEVSPLGGVTSYLNNGFGEPIQIRNPLGTLTQILRDDAGRPRRVTVHGQPGGPTPPDRSGQGNVLLSDIFLEPDAMGRVIRQSQVLFDPAAGTAAGVVILVATKKYSPGGLLLEESDLGRRTTTYRWDTAHRLERVERPGGHVVAYAHDGGSRVIRETRTEQPEGSPLLRPPAAAVWETSRSYDALGRKEKETRTAEGTWKYAYNSDGRVRATQKPNGGTTTIEYDLDGRQTARALSVRPNPYIPQGLIRIETTYDENGNTSTTQDARGGTTAYAYDPLDRLRRVTDPDGRYTEAELDAGSNPTLVRARDLREIHQQYDRAGQLIARQFSSSVSPTRLRQKLEHDGLGRVTRLQDSQGGSDVSVAYNSLGWPIRETQNGAAFAAEYDPGGMVDRLVYPSGRELSLGIGSTGKVESLSVDGRLLCRYSYLGDRVEERRASSALIDPQSGLLYPMPIVHKNYFLASGQLRSFAHLVDDRVTQPASPRTIYLHRFGSLHYDAAGRLLEKRTPSSTVTFQYDEADRVIHAVLDPTDLPGVRREGTLTVFDGANNARERETAVTPRQGASFVTKVTTTPDALNAPAQREIRSGGGPPQTLTLQFDRNGHLQRGDFTVRRQAPLADLPAQRRLAYDALGRLEMVFLETTGGADDYRIFYRYDGFGRRVERIQQRVHGSLPTVMSEQQTRYLFWGDRCLEEWERDGDTGPWTRARRYYHGVEPGEVVALGVDEDYLQEDVNRDGRMQGEARLLYLQDHDRSVLGLGRLEEHGSRYRPVYERYVLRSDGTTEKFRVDDQGGLQAIRESMTRQPVHLHGRWHHSLERLYYQGRRFLDEDSGQFVARDPLGPWADPLSLGNAYTFAGANPVMNTDSGGEFAAPLVIGAVILANWAITAAAAELTESDVVASFSPVHNLVTAWNGYTYFDHKPLGALGRGLGVADFALSLLPGLAYAARGVRGVVTTLRGADKAADALKGARGGAKAASEAGEELLERLITESAKRANDARLLARAEAKIASALEKLEPLAHAPFSGLTKDAKLAIYADDLLRGAWAETRYLKGAFTRVVVSNALNSPRLSYNAFVRLMAHEADHVLFHLKHPLLKALSAKGILARAPVKWVDESLAYATQFGGYFRPLRSLRALTGSERAVIALYAGIAGQLGLSAGIAASRT